VKRYGSLTPQIGRHVIIADLLAVHPGDPRKCLCRGTGQVSMVQGGEGVFLKECGKALAAFRQECGWRTVDTPQGPHWKIGLSPEEFGLFLIFQGEMRDFLFREQLRRTVGLA
jgi:hypothetical protein